MAARKKQTKQSLVKFDANWTPEQQELVDQLLDAKYSRMFSRDAGKPTALTVDLMERFLRAASQGLPLELCCSYCMIDTTLFFSWRDWYKRIKKRIDPILNRVYQAEQDGVNYELSHNEQHSLRLSDTEATVVEFFDKISMMQGAYGLRIITGMNVAAMNGDSRAATWLLKSAFPKHYSETPQDDTPSENAGVGYAYIEINAVQRLDKPADDTHELTAPVTVDGEVLQVTDAQ